MGCVLGTTNGTGGSNLHWSKDNLFPVVKQYDRRIIMTSGKGMQKDIARSNYIGTKIEYQRSTNI
jgi:hypothetical protein